MISTREQLLKHKRGDYVTVSYPDGASAFVRVVGCNPREGSVAYLVLFVDEPPATG